MDACERVSTNLCSQTSTGHCYYKDKASAQSLLQDSKVTLQELGLKDAALMKVRPSRHASL